MSLFESQKRKEQKSHLMNLLSLCYADGEISNTEAAFLLEIGQQRFGLSPEEVQKMLKKPAKIKFSPPKSDSDRFNQLWDMVILMFADGIVTRGEMDFCMSMATKLGFKPSVVDDLVKNIINAIEKGKKKEKVKSEVEVWLNN